MNDRAVTTPVAASESRRATSRAEKWELIERWCEHYPDDWRLLFQRDRETLEVSVPEDVWRAFDRKPA
jgi:hypothetical protein